MCFTFACSIALDLAADITGLRFIYSADLHTLIIVSFLEETWSSFGNEYFAWMGLPCQGLSVCIMMHACVFSGSCRPGMLSENQILA